MGRGLRWGAVPFVIVGGLLLSGLSASESDAPEPAELPEVTELADRLECPSEAVQLGIVESDGRTAGDLSLDALSARAVRLAERLQGDRAHVTDLDGAAVIETADNAGHVVSIVVGQQSSLGWRIVSEISCGEAH